MDHTFSVVMPTLFREEKHRETLERCIESVVSYSSDYELIIVDDGSTLTSESLQNAGTLVRHKINRGIAPSWNDGIKLARGKYIAVINDDIIVPKGWLQDLKLAFESIPDCGVVAPRVEHLPDPSMGIAEKISWFPGSCFMLSQKTVKTLGYFDEQFAPFNCEDVDYWERLLSAGMKMGRNFNVYVEHKEGDVLHSLDYKAVDNINITKLIAKWGYDPRGKFYS